MAWIGYYEFGGTEIINVARTETYAKNLNLGWFTPVYRNDDLAEMLAETYTSPMQDDAPWIDPSDPASFEFCGFYPLDVTGLENSSMTARVIESTLDGGVVGKPRRSTRQVVFNGVIVAGSECSAEYGLRWLRAALHKGSCANRLDTNCNGGTLRYLSCEPALPTTEIPDGSEEEATIVLDGGTAASTSGSADGGSPSTTTFEVVYDGGNPESFQTVDEDPESLSTAEQCFIEYQRLLYRVTVTNGPNITRKINLVNGSAWTVQFTATLANPREYGYSRPFVEGFMDPNVGVPYVGGVPDGGAFDTIGVTTTETECPVAVFEPVYDPLCPVIIAPPPVPEIDLTCVEFPDTFVRRKFTIPESFVPTWGEAVPVIRVTTGTTETRSVRLRFYADTFGTGDPADDPCNYAGDILFSYIPANSTMTVDSINKQVYIEVEGQAQRADSLVFATDGSPFVWPELSCGVRYIVTVDMPETVAVPKVAMTLATRAA